MNRCEVRDSIATALAARWAIRTERNPEWDRKAEREAWRRGEEYPVPETIDRPLVEQIKGGPMEFGTGADGLPLMWVPSIEDIAEVAANAVMETIGK